MECGRKFLCSPKFLLLLLLINLSTVNISRKRIRNVEDVQITDEIQLVLSNNRFGNKNRTIGRAPRYLASKVLYTINGTSSFQLYRIILSGDVHPQPGPTAKRTIKYPCKECNKSVRSNQDAILCCKCKVWSHAKCAGLTKVNFKYYLDNPTIDWKCGWCVLPFSGNGDCFIEVEKDGEDDLLNITKISQIDSSEAEYANCVPKNEINEGPLGADNEPTIVVTRRKNSRGLMICHLNVNSIQNKFEELSTLVNQLKAHVIFLTETKIDASYSNSQFKLKGYHLYRNDRAKGGGGIMAYFASNLHTKKLKTNKKYNTFESLVIESKFGRHNVIVIGIYRPPKCIGSDYYVRLEEDLNDIVSWASLQTQFVIVTGDLNLNRLNPESREGKILRDLEDVHGLSCLIDKPTRITEASQTLLDIILTNKPELFRDSDVYDPGISDHALVYGIMNEKGKHYPNKVVSFRSCKNLNVKDYLQDLQFAPWHVAEIFDTMDDQYSYWNMLFTNVIDDHAPRKKMRVRAKDVPYMTPEWKKAIKEKRKYQKRYSRNPTQENLRLKNFWRNNATKIRRKAVKNYWLVKTESAKTDPREFYTVFKPFLDSKSSGIDDTRINLEIDGRLVTNQTEVANYFVNHFADVAADIGDPHLLLSTEKELENHKSVQDIQRNKKIVNAPKFEFHRLGVSEVEKSLRLLNQNKSAGYDQISPRLLSIASKELAPSLSRIYNGCIEKCCWPVDWKKGTWTPVYKKDDHKDLTNYRPITVLSTIDKVFEQLLASQVSHYIEPYLNRSLTAYRKRNSCETTLIKLLEDWKKSLDEKKVVGVLSSDLSKAFDSLHPPLLLAKLKGYGFNDGAIELLRSYFSERRNQVRLGSEATSAWKTVVRGCPQGSNFGPLMWNIFQNDLVHNIDHSRISMYADDHQIYTGAERIEDVERTLTTDGQNIMDWYETNLLKCNHDKFQTISFGQKHRNKDMNIKLALNNDIKVNSEMKLLGVIFDEYLKFDNHIENLSKKVGRKVGVIMRLRNLLPTIAKLRIYKSFILPQLTYCHLVWQFCRQSDSRKVERLQEKALRAIYRDKNSTYSELLSKAKLTTLSNRRLQDIAILMYKVKNELCPNYIIDIFSLNTKHYGLRNSDDFIIPRFNSTTYGKHSLRYMGPVIWAKLPKDVKNSESISIFKSKVRKLDINNFISEKCNNCYLCDT